MAFKSLLYTYIHIWSWYHLSIHSVSAYVGIMLWKISLIFWWIGFPCRWCDVCNVLWWRVIQDEHILSDTLRLAFLNLTQIWCDGLKLSIWINREGWNIVLFAYQGLNQHGEMRGKMKIPLGVLNIKLNLSYTSEAETKRKCEKGKERKKSSSDLCKIES